MSTLAPLSDSELDAVNGGWYGYTNIDVTKIVKVNTALNSTSQSQTNVAILAIAKQGGSQSNQTIQEVG